MYTFTGDNPTKMYYDAMNALVEDGDVVAPRGKVVKELRPAAFEYNKPTNRVTFLGSRRINPFFQLAESLWILSGRADVEWLVKFNKNMSSFSDDGIWFNAPYGERIRTWNKNSAHNIVINPIDQLADAYMKLSADKDTRQAVVVISNPMFDNYNYTVGEKGKDIACNLIFTFKIRHGKLNITVFNRSNDLHWGVMGANLCQFSTIQETMAAWLGVEVGTYTQITDSLHIYLDDYGAKCTTDVIDYYESHDPAEVENTFECKQEPRMSLNREGFDQFLSIYWGTLDGFIMDDDYIQNPEDRAKLIEMIDDMHRHGIIDDYWTFAVKAMLAYRLNRLGHHQDCLEIIAGLEDCQWKISMLYFMKSIIKKDGKDVDMIDDFNDMVEIFNNAVNGLTKSLVDENEAEALVNYLTI